MGIVGLMTNNSLAQSKELRWNLSEDGKQYFKVTLLNQTWIRFNESNTGTTVVGESTKQTMDMGLRRTRIQMFGQIAPRTFMYFQFGQNNFNFLAGYPNGNRKIQPFFHDALGEYQVFKDKEYLKIGAGLTMGNGLSRFTQPSISSILTLDAPVFAQATTDQIDEFGRKLSLYARGQVGKIDYRVLMSDPFPISSNGQTPAPLQQYATFAQKGHHKQYQGYVMYQFLEHESNTTPYMTGTYLGKKSVFNIAAGFITQKNATWTREALSTDTVYHNMNLFAIESFLDKPLNAEKGTAISAYLGYFNYDFGKNYLRYNGIMNPANATTQPITGVSGATQGNAFPMFGTGNIVYGQVGYLLPKSLLGDKGQLQPYASLMHANFERLSDPMNVFDIGANWLISGHNSKISIDYQNRPNYKMNGSEIVKDKRRSCIMLQYQVFI